MNVTCAVRIGTAIALLTASASALADCAECSWTHSTKARIHPDQNACPGANRVVCEYYWEENKSAACVPAGAHDNQDRLLENCQAGKIQMFYATKQFPPNTCANWNQKTNQVDCVIPAAGGPPGPREARPGWVCKGDPWLDVVSLALADRYSVDFVLPAGPVVLPGVGETRLGDVRIQVEGKFIKAAGSKLTAQKDDVLLDLVIHPDQMERVSFPNQTFRPQSVDRNVRIISTTVEKSKVTWKIAVKKTYIGAFNSYSMSLRGLRVKINGSVSGSIASLDGDADDMREVILFAEVVSGGETLAGGAATIGKMAPVRTSSAR